MSTEGNGLDRRGFLRGAAATAVGTPVLGGLAADRAFGHGRDSRHRPHGHGSIPRESISIQLYTLRDQLAADLERHAEALARIGYRTVEHAGFGGRTAAEFKARCATPGCRRRRAIRRSRSRSTRRRGRRRSTTRSRSGSATSSPRRARSLPAGRDVADITGFRPRPVEGVLARISTGPARWRGRPACGSATTATTGSGRARGRHAADRLRLHDRRDRPAARALRARPLLGLVRAPRPGPADRRSSATASGSSTSRT